MQPTRAVPALFLLVAGLVFAWAYAEYASGQSVPAASFILPPLAALALGGLVDPRILWSVGPRRHLFPPVIRVVGALLFGVGLVVSAVLLVHGPRP